MSQHIDLIIATPGANLTSDYVRSLISTLGVLSEHGITAIWTNGYSSHVADAREQTLAGSGVNDVSETKPLSGQVTYNKILWIDSDIAWNPEDAVKLYNSDKDVISGVYFLGHNEIAAYPEFLKQGFTREELEPHKNPLEVESVGFGFVCVKQGIFEQLSRPWFQSVETTTEYRGKKYTFNVPGEDISWCYRVKELGYKIWLDPTVQVVHQRTFKLGWEGISL